MPQSSITPRLPVAFRPQTATLTVGPEAVLALYDKCIVKYGAKARIAQFLSDQERKHRTCRPLVSPLSLGKLILKRARRRVTRNPEPMHLAVLAAGNEVLKHYIPPVHQPRVFKAFEETVRQLSR